MSPLGRKSLVLGISGLLLALAAGCSKQGEGERCDREAAGDNDCEPPLICQDVGQQSAANPIQRCCPRRSEDITDERCDASSVQASVGGTGGTAPAQVPAESDAGAGGANGGAGSEE